MTEYKSSVLKCNVEDHHCATCRFLNGSRATTDLLETIENLDKMLAIAEKERDDLLRDAFARNPTLYAKSQEPTDAESHEAERSQANREEVV